VFFWVFFFFSSKKILFFIVGGQFLDIAKSGDDPQEDLARFGYKLNMKVKFLNATSIFLAHPLEPCVKIRRVFIKF
jgi:hypothetical protein